MKFNNLKASFIVILFSVFVFSCAPYEDEDDIIPNNNEQTTFGIRHDKTLADYNAIGENNMPFNTSEYPDFSSVICFTYTLDGKKGEDYVATGTLVAPNWILTAGHNFFVAEEQSSPAPASGITVNLGPNPNSPTSSFDVEKLVFHPTWLTDNRDFVFANDLCLVKLKGSVNTIQPAEINYDKTEEIGSTVWYGGFGDYSQTSGQNSDLLSTRHAIENVLDRKTDGVSTIANGITYTGGLLAFDFDNPTGNINTLGDDIVNEDEALLGSGSSSSEAKTYEGTTIEGDSGGPLFIKKNNKWMVAGVLSGGAAEPISNHKDSSYGDISIFIRTSTHADWIKSTIGK